MPKDPVSQAWNAIVGPFILTALLVGGVVGTVVVLVVLEVLQWAGII